MSSLETVKEIERLNTIYKEKWGEPVDFPTSISDEVAVGVVLF